MNSVKQMFESAGIRTGLTIYYGIACGIAVNRFLSALSGELPKELTSLHVAMYAGFTLVSWALLKSLDRWSDRVAVFLYGLFYAIRVVTNYVAVGNVSLLEGVECGIISVGMIAMIVGLVRVVRHHEPRSQADATPSQ
jgi:hypothetical protein